MSTPDKRYADYLRQFAQEAKLSPEQAANIALAIDFLQFRETRITDLEDAMALKRGEPVALEPIVV